MTIFITPALTAQVANIQKIISNVSENADTFSTPSKDMNDMVATIAAAVEEQTVTTGEIAQNITEASGGISDVTENISQSSLAASEVSRNIMGVNKASGELTDRTAHVNTSAEVLAQLSGNLKEMVSRFRV